MLKDENGWLREIIKKLKKELYIQKIELADAQEEINNLQETICAMEKSINTPGANENTCGRAPRHEGPPSNKLKLVINNY